LTADKAPASPDGVAGAQVLELVAVMDRLRRECPWDRRQTHSSLAPYLLEECYEALDALERGDLAALREELGDVLLQVVFHARLAAERTDGTGWTIDDVADGIVAKLIRRTPAASRAATEKDLPGIPAMKLKGLSDHSFGNSKMRFKNWKLSASCVLVRW